MEKLLYILFFISIIVHCLWYMQLCSLRKTIVEKGLLKENEEFVKSWSVIYTGKIIKKK